MAKRSPVGKLASSKAKTQFARELSSFTALTAKEVEELFPAKADRDELLELIKIVNSDASDKRKKAELVEKIGKVGGAVIKIAKKFAIGI